MTVFISVNGLPQELLHHAGEAHRAVVKVALKLSGAQHSQGFSEDRIGLSGRPPYTQQIVVDNGRLRPIGVVEENSEQTGERHEIGSETNRNRYDLGWVFERANTVFERFFQKENGSAPNLFCRHPYDEIACEG
jgi:hypothetical protein